MPALFAVVLTCLLEEPATQLFSLFVVLNYKSIPDACHFAVVSTCKSKEPTIQLQKI